MLEEMAAFFAKRLEGYEDHMRKNIAFAPEFYPETARMLPLQKGIKLLDLGCGTGLELDEVYALLSDVDTVGIDLCAQMLEELKKKPYAHHLHLIQGSYFDVPFGENEFDAAVSVESLHHFTAERKLPLYQKLYRALKDGGVYVETDYAAADDQEEAFYFSEYERMAKGAEPGAFHYDTPLTREHTLELLKKAGFESVTVEKNYENTALIVAKKKTL
ncbi:MAG: class I SAM-dependent methyltransferase [Clostridiales bacterium]|nr:class I SAM-dependent methyltransferase [Clostridiales bacterium]